MKRALLTLLALCVPALAHAANPGRLLIIYPGQAYGIATSTINEDDTQRRAIIAHCKLWKIRYTLVPAQSCNTWFVRRGTLQKGAGDSLTHDGVVLIGFQVGRMNTEVPGFSPESLTLSVCAPTVPVIFCGVPSAPFTQTAGCSTGVTADNLGSGAQDSVDSAAPSLAATQFGNIIGALAEYEGQFVQDAYAWKSDKQNNSVNTVGAARVPPGLWRPMIRTYRTGMTGAAATCVNCDSAHTTTGNTGKFQVWMRDQYSIGDRSLFKPIYFVHAFRSTAGSPSVGGVVNFALALASADSFAGKTIYGSDPVVRRVSAVITGLHKRRAITTTQRGGNNGLQGTVAGIVSSDSAGFMVAVDTVYAYQVRDNIPIAVGCEVDSLDEYPRDQTYLLDRLWKWKVFPFAFAGSQGQASFGNSSRDHPMDLQAYDRATSAFGSLGVTQGPESCYVWRGESTQQTRDTSLVCKLHFALNLLRARFGSDRVSPTIMFGLNDYGSKTAIAAMGEDSLFSALSTAGVGAFITLWRGWAPGEGRYRDHLYRTSYGARGPRMLRIASAGQNKSGIGADRQIPVQTEYANKALDGFFSGVGTSAYQTEASTTGEQYAQAIMGSASILCLDVSHFGNGGNAINNFHGPRTLKYVANPVALFNRFAGRTLLAWDWPENVTVEP